MADHPPDRPAHVGLVAAWATYGGTQVTLRGDTREEWRILQDLGAALGVLNETDPSAEAIFDRIARTVPAFAGLSYTALGDMGAPLQSATANVAVG